MSFRRIAVDISGQYDLMELGVAGENLATRIIIDCSSVVDLFPNALISVLIRHDRCMAYPAAIGLQPDCKSLVYYDVTQADTSVAGKLSMEIQAIDGDVLVKSVMLRFNVLQSIGKVMDTPFNPGQAWEDRLIRLATDVSRETSRLERFIDLVSDVEIKTVNVEEGQDITLTWEIIPGEENGEPDKLLVIIGLPPGFGIGEIPPGIIEAGTIEIVETLLVTDEEAAFVETDDSTSQHRKYKALIPAATALAGAFVDQKISDHDSDENAHPNINISGGVW